MTPYARAFLIAMLGPIIQAAGVAWDLLEHGVFARGELDHITFQHIVSGPAHLLMAAGFALSCVCIPIAIEVAIAGVRGVEEEEPDEEPETAPYWHGSAPEPKP